MFYRKLNICQIVFLASAFTISPAALSASDSTANPTAPKTSTLKLSVEDLPVSDSGSGGGSNEADQTKWLTDTQKQAMENLQAIPQEHATKFQPAKKDDSSTEISGSLMTKKSQSDSLDPVEAGKDYLDSVDGAKVDMKLKF